MAFLMIVAMTISVVDDMDKTQICTAISSRLMLSMFIYLVSTQHAYIT